MLLLGAARPGLANTEAVVVSGAIRWWGIKHMYPYGDNANLFFICEQWPDVEWVHFKNSVQYRPNSEGTNNMITEKVNHDYYARP